MLRQTLRQYKCHFVCASSSANETYPDFCTTANVQRCHSDVGRCSSLTMIHQRCILNFRLKVFSNRLFIMQSGMLTFKSETLLDELELRGHHLPTSIYTTVLLPTFTKTSFISKGVHRKRLWIAKALSFQARWTCWCLTTTTKALKATMLYFQQSSRILDYEHWAWSWSQFLGSQPQVT